MSKLFDRLMVFLKDFFENIDFVKKYLQIAKIHAQFPSMQWVIELFKLCEWGEKSFFEVLCLRNWCWKQIVTWWSLIVITLHCFSSKKNKNWENLLMKKQYGMYWNNWSHFVVSLSKTLYPHCLIVILHSKLWFQNKSKEEGKDQESIQSSTTPDPGYRIGKWQKHKKTSHTREPRGQPFPSRWSQGCKKQTRQYGKDKRKTQNNKKDPQKKHRLGMVSKKITG